MESLKRNLHAVLAAVVLVATGTATAGPPPPPPIEELTALYEALDGDNWHRNDNWLDEEIHHCDWYGIICREDIAPRGMSLIELQDNNLHGDVADIIEPINQMRVSIDLSDNNITGELAELPPIGLLDLSRNQISGVLPEIDSDINYSRTHFIRLSNNHIEGQIPASWAQQLHELVELDLSANLLEGSLPTGLEALPVMRTLNLAGNDYDHWPEDLVWPPNITELDLSRNQLSGAIPDSVLTAETLFANPQASLFGGLDLCWNDLHAADEVVESFVRERHRGIHFELCQGREFADLDAQFSGSLYDPQRSGEGITLMQLESGDLLVFSFTYDRDERQRWRFGVTGVEGAQAIFDPFYETHGRFGFGYDPEDVDGGPLTRGQLEIDALTDNRLALLKASVEPLLIPMTGMARIGLRLEYQPLTRLAGTTCDNTRPNQWISGAWYDPERDGEGFIVEVTENGHGVAYWYTYVPDESGRQAWMMGDGDFDGTTLVIDNLIQPQGGIFGADFDSDLVEPVHWGTLTLEFHDDLSGHVNYDSVFEDYGTGDYPIERLARPMLAECEGDD